MAVPGLLGGSDGEPLFDPPPPLSGTPGSGDKLRGPGRMGYVRRQPLFLRLTLATLTCALLAGCTGASTPSAARSATAPPAQPPASSPHVTGPAGSPGNPLVVSCDAESWPGPPSPPAPFTPGPHDLAVGPVYFPGGRALATYTPAQYGYAPFGRHSRFYKLALVVRPGATVTVTVGASARGHAVIAAPGVGQFGLGGVTSATYHACRQAGGFFAQGFAFTRPPFRGCVPIDVTVGGQARVRHVTLPLFARSCAA
jgi:hypothetical protein